MNQSLSGPGYLLRGFRLLLLPGVRGFMLVPLLGNIVLYTSALVLALWGLDAGIDRWLPESVGWLRWILFPLLLGLVLIVAFFTFTLLGNLLLAPFNGVLSERVERALTGSTQSVQNPFGWAWIRRTVAQEARRLGYVVLLLLAVFLLGLVPVVGLIAVPLGLTAAAWLLAFDFASNPLGNWGYDFARQRRVLRSRRLGVLGFGFAAMGLSLVPVVNFALMPAAVAGMTAFCLKLRDEGPAPEPASRGE